MLKKSHKAWQSCSECISAVSYLTVCKRLQEDAQRLETPGPIASLCPGPGNSGMRSYKEAMRLQGSWDCRMKGDNVGLHCTSQQPSIHRSPARTVAERTGPFKSLRAPPPREHSFSLATAPGEGEALATALSPGASRDGPQLERERAPRRAPARRGPERWGACASGAAPAAGAGSIMGCGCR